MHSKNFDHDPVLQSLKTNKVDLTVFALIVIKYEISCLQKKEQMTFWTYVCGTMGHSSIKPELSRKNRDQWDTYTYQVEGHDARLIRQ